MKLKKNRIAGKRKQYVSFTVLNSKSASKLLWFGRNIQ